LAQKMADEIKAGIDKSIGDINLSIAQLQGNAGTITALFEGLKKDKERLEQEHQHPAFLEMFEKELKVIKQNINVNSELIAVYKDSVSACQGLSNVYDDRVSLLKSGVTLSENIAEMPAAQISTIKKEADVAKDYISLSQSNMKEKQALVLFFAQELEDVRGRIVGKEEDFARNLELQVKAVAGNDELVSRMREKAKGILSWQKAVDEQWITVFKTRLETTRIRYDKAVQSLKNAELNADLLTEKSHRLEEIFNVEPAKKEDAPKVAANETVTKDRKVEGATSAKVDEGVSPVSEKKKTSGADAATESARREKWVKDLEVEAQHLPKIVAQRKDELITEGKQRFKDASEYKKATSDIEFMLSSAGGLKEIKELQGMHDVVDAQIDRFTDMMRDIEECITTLKEDQKHSSHKVSLAREEESVLKEEIASFSNKELGRKAIECTQRKRDALEEDVELIAARINILNERLETARNAVESLNKAKDKLITIEAANVWTRMRSNISVQTLKTIGRDVVNGYDKFKLLHKTVLSNFKEVASALLNKKDTVSVWFKCGGLLFLIAAYYISKRYLRRWCERVMDTLQKAGSVSFYRGRLFPILLLVLQQNINRILLAILSLAITAVLNVWMPFVVAVIYVLTIFAVYKVLKRFLIESFHPGKGNKVLFPSLVYLSSEQWYRALNGILVFSLITLSAIAVLSAFNYKADVLELLWFIYRLGMLILVLWLASQRALIFRLLPGTSTPLGKIIHRVVTVIYPIFIAFVVSLFAIRSLGYPVLSYVLLKISIKSFIIAIVAFAVWKLAHSRINLLRGVRFKKIEMNLNEQGQKGFRKVTELFNLSCQSIISLVTAIIIIRVWVSAFSNAIASPAAPYTVQKTFGYIDGFFSAIGSGMQYRFIFSEGRYTTPLKMIIALAVLFASFFVARHIKTLLDEKVLYKLPIERGIKHALSTLSRYFVVGIAALIGLNMAGIPLQSLTFFAGAFGIGVGFGMQNIISNFVSGIILLLERPMRVGDVITLEDGVVGTVDKLSVRSTTITTTDGITLIVPNSKFVESKITNLTHPKTLASRCE
ncbi:MAG: mechanosensitive ion channel domain-containing protein, partial [Planctomycetota bacterium]